jgi:hypothetical protein
MSHATATRTLALIDRLSVERIDALARFDFRFAEFCAAKISALTLRMLCK